MSETTEYEYRYIIENSSESVHVISDGTKGIEACLGSGRLKREKLMSEGWELVGMGNAKSHFERGIQYELRRTVEQPEQPTLAERVREIAAEVEIMRVNNGESVDGFIGSEDAQLLKHTVAVLASALRAIAYGDARYADYKYWTSQLLGGDGGSQHLIYEAIALSALSECDEGNYDLMKPVTRSR
jgi:hypothetical protein